MRKSTWSLWLLVFSCFVISPAYAKLGKFGRKADGADGSGGAATPISKYDEFELAKGHHGDPKMGGAGGYVDVVSLPAIADKIGGAIYELEGHLLGLVDADEANDETSDKAIDAALPDAAAAKLLKDLLIAPREALSSSDQGPALFQYAAQRTGAPVVYLGKTSQLAFNSRVYQFVCATPGAVEPWFRYLSTAQLVLAAVEKHCGGAPTLFLNHAAFVDAKKLVIQQTLQPGKVFIYAADADSHRVSEVDLPKHIRRLDKCCIWAQPDVHPGTRFSLESMVMGTSEAVEKPVLLVVGQASAELKQAAVAKGFALEEVTSYKRYDKLNTDDDTVLIVGATQALLVSYQAGKDSIAPDYQNDKLYVRYTVENEAAAQAQLAKMITTSDNYWSFIQQFGGKGKPTVLAQHRQTYPDDVVQLETSQQLPPVNPPFQLTYYLTKNNMAGCNPYLWDCPTKGFSWLMLLIGIGILIFVAYSIRELWGYARNGWLVLIGATKVAVDAKRKFDKRRPK